MTYLLVFIKAFPGWDFQIENAIHAKILLIKRLFVTKNTDRVKEISLCLLAD